MEFLLWMIEGTTTTVQAINAFGWLLSVIGMWLLFSKFGESGWKSLIPLYNEYTMFKVFWDTKWFWIRMLLAFVVVTLYGGAAWQSAVTGSFIDNITPWILGSILISLVLTVVNFVIEYNYCKNIALSCNEGFIYTIGLLLLKPLFLLILGVSFDETKNEFQRWTPPIPKDDVQE